LNRHASIPGSPARAAPDAARFEGVRFRQVRFCPAPALSAFNREPERILVAH
jgi:hypothetical protein